MTTVLIDARLALRGLGIGTYIDRLMSGFSDGGGYVPTCWRANGEWGPGGVLSTLARSGLFDVSPRLDPRSRGFDVVHYASNLGALVPGRHSVVTVHDVMHRRRARRRDRISGAVLEHSLPRAGRVVAISGRTRDSLEQLLPGLRDRIEVIPHGMRRRVLGSASREHILAFGGASDPRKRTSLMLAIYRAYRDSTPGCLPLVVLARSGLSIEQRRELVDMGARIIASASSDDVDRLMGSAAALIYPTKEEGFGLPILEAAETCTPVVMDEAATVAEEVIGDHCFLVRSEEVGGWVRELQRAIAAVPVRSGLELPDWTEVADRYRALYEGVSRHQ